MSDIQQPGPQIMVPHLKSDAKVTIVIGSAFIQKLEKAFEDHIIGHEEELKVLEAKKDYDNLTPWEDTAVMFSTLMQEIMRIAKESGQVEDIPLTHLTPSGPGVS